MNSYVMLTFPLFNDQKATPFCIEKYLVFSRQMNTLNLVQQGLCLKSCKCHRCDEIHDLISGAIRQLSLLLKQMISFVWLSNKLVRKISKFQNNLLTKQHLLNVFQARLFLISLSVELKKMIADNR